jgi:hypothetical protein
MKTFAFHEKDTYKWWVLVTVSIGTLTVSLDNSILAACLPHLVKVFHTDSLVVGWVNIAYLIATQSLMLAFAKIGDEKGRKMVYMIGTAFYTAGLLMCALSQGIGQLIFARTLQGIGAATTLSLSMAIAAGANAAIRAAANHPVIRRLHRVFIAPPPLMRDHSGGPPVTDGPRLDLHQKPPGQAPSCYRHLSTAVVDCFQISA